MRKKEIQKIKISIVIFSMGIWATIIAAIIFTSFLDDPNNSKPFNLRDFDHLLALLASIPVLAALAVVLLRYLESNYSIDDSNKEFSISASDGAVVQVNDIDKEEIEKNIDNIQLKVKELEDIISDISLDDKEKNELKDALMDEIRSDVTSEFIAELKKDIPLQLTSEKIVNLKNSYRASLERIQREVRGLEKRGNLNLIIGILATIVGFLLFWTLILAEGAKYETTEALLGSFVPRLSLVLLIELFAYFFLGLYKTSLTEIKYFQNELTNLELKYLALEQAIALNDKPTIKKILDNFAATERNFLLKKGETTVALEQEKLSQQEISGLLSSLKALLSNMDKTQKPK